jgi:CRISPR-associated endonuclease/helicase Cas3
MTTTKKPPKDPIVPKRPLDWSGFEQEKASDPKRNTGVRAGPGRAAEKARPPQTSLSRQAPATPPHVLPSRAGADSWLHLALGLPDGATPFPWQQRLLVRFLEGDVPRALDIPTGLGKTSVMAVWLVARALGAAVPRRLVYVVDRRAVVDQATTIAVKLQQFVEEQPDVKNALGLGARPESDDPARQQLPISTLRGQHVDKREWLEDPAAPAIVVGTVDMVGSRLLFEGYGVSWKMRPYHAGLLGADALLVVDEAHLVPPFERLLEAVAAAKAGTLGPAPELASWIPSVRLLSLSATGKRTAGALTLDEADLAHPVVAQRVRAKKVLVMREPVSKGELASALAKEAHDLGGNATAPQRVVVFCDTRDDAVKVAAQLEKLKKGAPIELFVGGRRVHERFQLEAWLREHGFLAGSSSPDESAFLVCTSAAEVGVDLDADHAVADVVAWERMVQRLGRVNRRGTVAAQVVLVPLEGKERGPELRAGSLALIGALPRVDGGADGSPAALVALRELSMADAALAETILRATTPALLHPPLNRATLEAWSMTSLREHPGRPEVEPWLRGWREEEEEPETKIAFRSHLPLVDGSRVFDDKTLESFLETAGPHTSECLETEVWRAREWLGKRIELYGKTEEQLRTSSEPSVRARAERALDRSRVWAVAIERGPRPAPYALTQQVLEDKRRQREVDRVLSKSVLIVDACLGGLTKGMLSSDTDVADLEDLDLTQHLPKRRDPLPFVVRRLNSLEEPPLITTEFEYEEDKAFAIEHDDEGAPKSWLRVERRKGDAAVSETGRSVAARPQTLVEHQAWVADEARAIAARLDLPADLARVLGIAARLHDEGKQVERWQRAFHVPKNQRPLAKSTRAPNVSALGGYRHELGSLSFVERDSEFLALNTADRDLALHLVAAHHGRARPVLPTDGAEEPPALLKLRAREVALRFDRLSRRFGPWGLAWLEALLRAADQRASKRNDLGGRHG